MNWIKKIWCSIKPIKKTKSQLDAELFFLGELYKKRQLESPYRHRTVMDRKLGRSYNTGDFHTKMPK